MDHAGVTRVETGPDQVSYQTTVNRPAAELFTLLADPAQHQALDGSGTVRATTSGPPRLTEGARFTVNMKQFGLPYKITSRVTRFVPDRLIEWRNPMGHRWRWSFEPIGDGNADGTDGADGAQTLVTETFDFSGLGARTRLLKLTGFDKRNGDGIENTLTRLQTS